MIRAILWFAALVALVSLLAQGADAQKAETWHFFVCSQPDAKAQAPSEMVTSDEHTWTIAGKNGRVHLPKSRCIVVVKPKPSAPAPAPLKEGPVA